MKKMFTAYGKIHITLLFLLGSAFASYSQVTLVKWVDFFGIYPPIAATEYLPMNAGKELSGSGQSAPAGVPTLFITSAPWDFADMIFCSNGWNVGAGVANFNFNFSTTNYNNIQVNFKFGILTEFGPRNFKTQYSTGSSTGPWTDFGSAISYPGAVPVNGLSSTPSFTLPSDCNNKTNVWVRIVTTDGSLPTGYTGGPFIDNIIINGTAMSPASITGHPSNATICEGSGTTFTVSADNAVSYQWEYRTSSAGTFVNVPDNATYDNVTTSVLTLNNAGAGMSGYEYRCRVTGGTPPDAVSNAAILTVNAYGTWNGSVSSEWNNPLNWNCGEVPSSSTNVTILPVGTPPSIGSGIAAVCNNINILPGAVLTITGSGNLDIKGNITALPGTLNATDGKVILSGVSDQTIPSGQYKILQVNSNSLKTLGGIVLVTQSLDLTLGKIVLNNFNLGLGTSAAITGAGPGSYIVTNGTGILTNQNIGAGGKTGSILFPVGSSATSYTPLILSNTGTADNFSVSVMTGIYESYTGTTGIDPVTEGAVNKTWFVTEDVPGGSNATMQLSWSTGDELAGFLRGSCAFTHFTGSIWEPQAITMALGIDPFFIVGSGITSFSPFSVASEGIPLSVDLLSFEGRAIADANELKWVSSRESNLKMYTVERSEDAKTFSMIGMVDPSNDPGQNEYTFIDKTSSSFYYRLMIADENGDKNYSDVIFVQRQGTGIDIFPNPAEDKLSIRILSNEHAVGVAELFNIQGKRVVAEEQLILSKGVNTKEVDISALPSGVYLYKLSIGSQLYTGKINKK